MCTKSILCCILEDVWIFLHHLVVFYTVLLLLFIARPYLFFFLSQTSTKGVSFSILTLSWEPFLSFTIYWHCCHTTLPQCDHLSNPSLPDWREGDRGVWLAEERNTAGGGGNGPWGWKKRIPASGWGVQEAPGHWGPAQEVPFLQPPESPGERPLLSWRRVKAPIEA